MSNTYLKEGESLDFLNGTGSAIVADEPVVVGDYGIGIAASAIGSAATDSGVVNVCGVFTLAKAAVAIVKGAPVYITVGAGTATAATSVAANGLYFAGRAEVAAASGDTTVRCILMPFTSEGAREITLAATGNQILSLDNFLNGAALTVKVPNTGALSVTFPLMSTIPNGMPVLITKTAADAAAITIAANASDSLVGSTGTVDAANDRVLLFTKSGGPIVVATVIA